MLYLVLPRLSLKSGKLVQVFFESWLKFCAVLAFRNLGIFWVNFWPVGGPGERGWGPSLLFGVGKIVFANLEDSYMTCQDLT